jgi:glucose-1-phosphate thymidylyltransferase
MEIAKALILAGRRDDDGEWPIAQRAPRHLFPLANRPLLFHNLEALRSAGVLEATILVEPESGAAIERAVGDGSDWGLTVGYADYLPSVGLAGALSAARSFLGGEPALVQAGDALLRERVHPHLAAFARDGLDAVALRTRAAGGRDLGYMLSPRAVSILLERPDAALDPVAGVRARGGRAGVQTVDGCLPCHGDQDTLLECNRRLLDELAPCVQGRVGDDCTLHGAVVVHPTARLARCTVRGPAIIGPGARLTDAYVGPHTSIGAGVVVEGAEIEHSIVLDGAELRFLGTRLDSCVIGQGARIVRRFSMPSTMRIAVGDGAEVLLA